MKKFQIGTLALAAVLAIGGGAVLASEKTVTEDKAATEAVVTQEASRVVTVDGKETEIYSEDEALLKAIDNGEVTIAIDETEVDTATVADVVPSEAADTVSTEGASRVVTVDGEEIEVYSDDEALLEAIANGEIEIIGATKSVPAQKAE